MPHWPGTYGNKVGRPSNEVKSNEKAFDSMLELAPGSSELFTESVYNTKLGKDEQAQMDRKAYDYLKRMYKDDKDSGLFEKLNFDQYVNTLSWKFFDERVTYPKKDDPEYFEEVGQFFGENYEGDFDQFKASAAKYQPKK